MVEKGNKKMVENGNKQKKGKNSWKWLKRLKTVENGEKQWKTGKNKHKWAKMDANGQTQLNMVDHGCERVKTVENG